MATASSLVGATKAHSFVTCMAAGFRVQAAHAQACTMHAQHVQHTMLCFPVS
jgi:hypothetical protein